MMRAGPGMKRGVNGVNPHIGADIDEHGTWVKGAREHAKLVAVEQMRENEDSRLAGIAARVQAHALLTEYRDIDGCAA